MATPENKQGASLDWFCPLCKEKLEMRAYPKGKGFVLVCKGTEAVPHRLRIYLDGFRPDAPFLLGPKVEGEAHPVRKSKIAELLERARKVAAA